MKKITVKDGEIEKTIKSVKEDCIIFGDGDSEFMWIVLVKERIVLECSSHYMTGEDVSKFTIDEYFDDKEVLEGGE